MPDENKQNEGPEPTAQPDKSATKPLRVVTVKHLDEPPPSGNRKIHPRRPAPIVPDRAEPAKDDNEAADDTDGDSSSKK